MDFCIKAIDSINWTMGANLKIKKLDSSAKIPTRGSEYAAGLDLYACVPVADEVIIYPGEVKKIHTGIAMSLPNGTFGAVYARSGLAVKEGLRPANCVGVIDSDYTGEVIVALRNDSNEPRCISHWDRVAQLVVTPCIKCDILEVDELEATDRGEGGFGSTGR